MPEELREKIALVIRQNTDPRVSLRDSKTITDEEIVDGILALIKEADYVRLAEDQSLPDLIRANDEGYWPYKRAQQDMLKARFQRVGL